MWKLKDEFRGLDLKFLVSAEDWHLVRECDKIYYEKI